jgi:hypothetical protein
MHERLQESKKMSLGEYKINKIFQKIDNLDDRIYKRI